MKTLYFIALLILAQQIAWTQKSFNDYVQIYPIGEDPNIRYMTSYTKQETILFEANPIVRYSIYNNFLKGLMKEKQLHTQAWYVSFRPQLRMYTDISMPVRTPSYKIFLGTQHLFRIPTVRITKQDFWGFSLESGHYSNGQDGSAFSEIYTDESPESDSIYNTIHSNTNLSKMLNRKSGNFSTNLTELILTYKSFGLDDDNIAKKMFIYEIGYTKYHDRFLGIANFGGFTEQDIKLYGRHHFMGKFEYGNTLNKWPNISFRLQQKINIITDAHRSVQPIRLETKCIVYPFKKSKALGFMTSYIYGHDNYNFRFVDAGHQFTIGITWSQFPPITLSNKLIEE